MKKQILILTENVEGGEWIATNRLTKAVTKLFPSIKFQYISFGKDIKHSNPNFFLGFLISHIIDFKISKKTIEEKIKEFGEIDYVISTHYLLLLTSLFIKELKTKRKIYYFLGLKSLPLNNFNNINHRNIFVKILEIFSILLSDYIIVGSEYSKNYIRKIIWPFSFFKKIYILPNFVPDNFYTDIVKKENNNFVILYSGRIVCGKGLENLIKGFNIFYKKNKNAILIFCYPKSSINKHIFKILKKSVDKFKLRNSIIFKTNLDTASLKKFYIFANLTILPSTFEMAPLSVIESLACNTPVIGTKVGNVPEILNKIDSRLILKSNNCLDISEKLFWFFNLNNNEVKNIKKRGLQLSKEYSSHHSVKIFLDILELLEK